MLTQIKAWILTDAAQPAVRIWGLTPAERLRRMLVTAGIANEHVTIGVPSSQDAQNGSLFIVRADYVFDERLIQALVASPNTALLAPSTNHAGKVVAVHADQVHTQDALRLIQSQEEEENQIEEVARRIGVRCLHPTDLAGSYISSLRRAEPPYLLPIDEGNIAAIESRLFAASYKGVTDLVTQWVWPAPAKAVTRVLARAGIRPNLITALSWLLVVLAALLFARGHFGLGLAAAWLMTFLDTVDGKLARVTVTSSRVGHVLDHGLDLIHPPFWYLAWAFGLPPHALWLYPAMLITVTGYVVGRAIEGLFMLAFKMEIHSWQRLDSYFRTVTARRNPNLILLTVATLFGRPDVGLILVALWTTCSIAFHLTRLAQAVAQRWRGCPVSPWQHRQTTTTGEALDKSTQGSASPA